MFEFLPTSDPWKDNLTIRPEWNIDGTDGCWDKHVQSYTKYSNHQLESTVLLEGIRITASIGRFDHVSEHHSKFHWLTVSSLIKYCCLCALHKIYHGDGIVLDPPIVFGTSHTYYTWSSNRFIQPVLCKLSRTIYKKLFRHLITHWWNDLPDDIVFADKFPSTLCDLSWMNI